MKKLMLMLGKILPLPFTANMARADDLDDALAALNNGDYATAFKLLKPLAEQGNADAQFNLGVMYQNGEGVLQDDKKAHMWFNIALANGSRKADEFIEIITRRMTPADISKAQDMAERCLASNYQDC